MDDLSGYSGDVRAVMEAQNIIAHCMKGPDFKVWTQLDLTIGQLRALMLLSADGDVTISSIAERMDIGKPASSILVDRLVHLGLARRTEDANDRRRTLVTLTDAGNELLTRLRQGNLDRFAQWLQAMAPDDLTALRRGLEALKAIADPSGLHQHALKSYANAHTRTANTVGATSGTDPRGE
jgi:DNA-binding MarR family transcriptional regulator